MNRKIVFRILFAFLILIFVAFIYSLLFTDSSSDKENVVEKILRSVGFDSADGSGSNPAVPLPSSYGGSSGGGSGAGSSGDSGGSSGGAETLSFCTFDLNHAVNGAVPCRCGFVAVCTEIGQTCDATFNNGQGVCS